jgi:high-affinity nickel-transport protein
MDADHIAAIDNVTRKLTQESERPLSVGFFFSLGHSMIVVVASGVVVYLTATIATTQLDAVKNVSEIVGTSISAFFLIAIALVDIVVLRGVWQTLQQVRKGGRSTDQSLDTMLEGSGMMARIFRPLFRMISQPLAHVSDWDFVRPRIRHGN